MMKYEEEAALFPHHDYKIIYRFVFKMEIDRLKESAFLSFFVCPPHAVKSIVCVYWAEKQQQVIPF